MDPAGSSSPPSTGPRSAPNAPAPSTIVALSPIIAAVPLSVSPPVTFADSATAINLFPAASPLLSENLAHAQSSSATQVGESHVAPDKALSLSQPVVKTTTPPIISSSSTLMVTSLPGLAPSENAIIVHDKEKKSAAPEPPLLEVIDPSIHPSCLVSNFPQSVDDKLFPLSSQRSDLLVLGVWDHTSISLFCDESYLCLLSNSCSEESADNGTLMSDEKFAEELQFQETLMAPFITSNNPPKDSPPKESKEAGESSRSYCEICAERRENDQMFPVQNCSHNCCITCITRYIAAHINKMGSVNQGNSAALTCPVGLDCEGILEIDACREIMPKYLISMWDDAICESMLDASQKFYCPYKDCSCLMVNDSGEVIREAECLSCRRLFCAQCNVPWHSGFGCEEFKGMDESERGREDLMVHQLAKEEKWQRCPGCRFFVVKNEGCLHMTCRCGFQFCYACGGTWTSTHGGCM